MRWVLLRGLTREAGHWGSFPSRLRERTGEDVVCVDLPGCGSRSGQRSPANVAAIACAVQGSVCETGQPAVVLALSLGAMVAIELCRLDGQVPLGCVLVNTSAAGGTRFWERLRPACYPTIARLALARSGAMAREARVLAMTSSRPRAHEQVLPSWARIASTRPVSSGNAVRQLWAAARFKAGDKPPVPLLLLASRGDALVSPQCSRRLASRWQVPLREHPWAGHDLPLDDPAWVIDEVAAWRKSHGW